MATIGQQLLQPEQGWKRYDDLNSAIKFTNATIDTLSGRYGGSFKYGSGMTVKFSFKGTKLRLIATSNRDGGYSRNIQVKIDGVDYYYDNAPTLTMTNQVIVFELLHLSDGEHFISVNENNQVINIDAIDIDSTGRLLHPDEVAEIKDLEIGKRIRCHYQTTTANTVGSFSNLGQETSDFIPVASSNVPNGDFYWIMVEDENKKSKLIADRNIQHSISWDTLNGTGIASGSGLPVNLNLNSRYFSTIRLLTGGFNNTDKDNEWDKHIVGSTLNGSVVAGDNNVWNSSYLYSLTSSTHPSASSNRVSRATTQNSLVTYGQIATNSVLANSGFRPVLIIENTLKTHTFIKSNNQYKTFKNNQWNNVSTTLPSESIFVSDGMQNLSILDRKETKFTQDMTNNGTLGEGKLFKSTIDLKKLFEIRKIEIQ